MAEQPRSDPRDPAIEQLEAAFEACAGAHLLVNHDRLFAERLGAIACRATTPRDPSEFSQNCAILQHFAYYGEDM